MELDGALVVVLKVAESTFEKLDSGFFLFQKLWPGYWMQLKDLIVNSFMKGLFSFYGTKPHYHLE